MRFSLPLKPVLMGAVMGPMMLMMLHGTLIGETDRGALALAVFVAAHILVIGTLALSAVFVARLSPRVQAWLARLHRPSAPHVFGMLGGAMIAAAVVHFFFHGGL